MQKRKPSTSTTVCLLLILFVIVAVITVIVVRQLTGGSQETAAVQVSASPSASASAAATTKPSASPSIETTPTPEATPEATPEPTSEPVQATAETVSNNGCSAENIDPKFTTPGSLLLLANKKHPLPEGYVPDNLVDSGIPCTNGSALMVQEAAQALQRMYNAALNDGVSLAISSAYRSESYQAYLYNGYVAAYGQAEADTLSSRPGYSDHQTGLTADFVEGGAADLTEAFKNTASGIWLQNHAH